MASKFLKIGAATLNQTPLAWEQNLQNIQNVLHEARKQKIELLCLPELCLTGYGCQDAFYADYVHEQAWTNLHELLPYTADLVVAVGLPILHNQRIYNVMAVVVNCEIKTLIAKTALAQAGVHYEPRWFTPWIMGEKSTYKGLTLGALPIEIGDLRIGFEICEDAWVINRPATYIADYDLDLILNPSASHFSFGKPTQRLNYILDSSRRFTCAYIYTNLLGNEAGRMIYDGSVVIAQMGKCLLCSDSFSFRDYELKSATLDLEFIRCEQKLRQVGRSFNSHLAIHTIPHQFKYSSEKPTLPLQTTSIESDKCEDFLKAIGLGLFDYMRKSYTQGFTISLSGGVDSSAVLVLCYFMVQMGIDQLGLEGFKAKLSYIAKLQDCSNLKAILKTLITTAYQATAQSSKTTFAAAQTLAGALNVTFHKIDLEPICQAYIERAAACLGRNLTWAEDDLALQNIQARSRSPQIWLLANLTNSLLLATANRSEIALGYCTMDGDTSGGLAPLGGIDKHFLRDWLKWVEVKKNIPDLNLINSQEPTAELRPLADKQTDEKDLMPYKLLNQIEVLAIRDKLSPQACYERLKFDYDAKLLKKHLNTFFNLWQQSQWKRERYAVSFHLDDYSLDPKSWCRFPILGGKMEIK